MRLYQIRYSLKVGTFKKNNNQMKILFQSITYKLNLAFFLLILFHLTACVVDEESHVLPQDDANDITWTVCSSDMRSGRALIENDELLQVACSSGGKSIGIWSAYELEGVVTENVLGNDNGDVSLVFHKDTEWDNYEWWTYGKDAAKWVHGAKYTFNAYFPMNVVNEISSSDVSTFVIEYNTERYQDDLMTAYACVDTKSSTFKTGVPVALNMLHTLSALRFQFSFINGDGTTYDDSDALTAFWLENTEHDKGIATTGILAFGTIYEDGTIDGEHIHWYHEDHPEPSNSTSLRKIYAWEDREGVDFSSTETTRNIAVAYSTNTDGLQKYAENNGWVLTIPQEHDGTTQICFQLRSTGDLVHHISLPITTYEAGKRYTYDIRFGQTTIELKLSIAEWNELKSTHDIPL